MHSKISSSEFQIIFDKFRNVLLLFLTYSKYVRNAPHNDKFEQLDWQSRQPAGWWLVSWLVRRVLGWLSSSTYSFLLFNASFGWWRWGEFFCVCSTFWRTSHLGLSFENMVPFGVHFDHGFHCFGITFSSTDFVLILVRFGDGI